MTRDVAVMPALSRLRLRLRRDPDERPEGESPDVPPARVEIVAYAEDCILSGEVALEADRLTDLLDARDELQLVNVRVRGLDTATTTEVPEFVVKRDDLLLIHASGPRGDQGRRRPTRQFPVRIEIGPYRVRGYLHVLPGSEPITSFRRRRAMVPLTEAWIEFDRGATPYRQLVGTVIVNRALVEALAEDIGADVELLDLPTPGHDSGRAKDFTYEVRAD